MKPRNRKSAKLPAPGEQLTLFDDEPRPVEIPRDSPGSTRKANRARWRRPNPDALPPPIVEVCPPIARFDTLAGSLAIKYLDDLPQDRLENALFQLGRLRDEMCVIIPTTPLPMPWAALFDLVATRHLQALVLDDGRIVFKRRTCVEAAK